jgi:hypothetical protein
MALRVAITCLRRRGIRIGSYRNVEIERGIGELRIEEISDPQLKRAVKTARVLNPKKRPADQLVPLRDVTLLWMKDDRMALMGIERVADMSGPCEYAQTWLCEWLDNAQLEADTLRGDWPPGTR